MTADIKYITRRRTLPIKYFLNTNLPQAAGCLPCLRANYFTFLSFAKEAGIAAVVYKYLSPDYLEDIDDDYDDFDDDFFDEDDEVEETAEEEAAKTEEEKKSEEATEEK